jgi:GDP-L-fucose synthase
MREFLHVDDMADGSVFVLELDDATLAKTFLNYPEPCFVNLGTGVDVTIRELAETVKDVVGFSGRLVFDPTKPDGTMRKLLDVSRAAALGWQARVGLREGIEATYRWFLENQGSFRK